MGATAVVLPFLPHGRTASVPVPTPLLQRRAVLAAAAAAAVAAGCAVVRRPSVALPVLLADGSILTALPALGKAYMHAHPDVRLIPYGQSPQSLVNPLQPAGTTYWLLPTDNLIATPTKLGNLAPLDTVLRDANFNPSVLIPGATLTLASEGHQWGLPYSLNVLALRYRADVFAALKIPAPAPDWTVADFEALCARLAVAMAEGKLPLLPQPPVAVLPPVWPTSQLQDLSLWAAFALGYGGTVVRDGRFSFDAAAVNGLAVLVDLLRRFAAPASSRVGSVSTMMAFASWSGSNEQLVTERYHSRWAYTRLPRFPVRPVIPTGARGTVVLQFTGRPASGQALRAAVQALVWLYTPDGQRILDGVGYVPVLNSAEAQQGFWSRQPASAQAIGDWRNFVLFNAGWPTPGAMSIALPSAIEAAVADPARLSSLLAAAAQSANNAAVGK